MTRCLLAIASAMTACTISAEQYRDDLWCEALRDAAEERAEFSFGTDDIPIDDGAVHVELADFSYTPTSAGRTHILASEAVALQVFNADGQFATQISVIEDHLCDDIARRWIFDLEPQQYFLQLRAGDTSDVNTVVLLAADDEDT